MDSMRRPRSSIPEAAELGDIRIAVFDDNPLFRAGIVHVLNAEPGMEVVAEGGRGSSALRSGAAPSLDVVVLDSDLMAVDRNLWHSIVGLRPAVRILVMAFSPDQEQVLATLAAGARGYILKGVSGRELLEAVRALHRNEGYVSPALAASMLISTSLASRPKGASASPVAQLTFREGKIFDLLADGLKNREIGRRLGVTEKTIKRYVTRIFEKLHVRNRVEAAMLSRTGARRVVVAPPPVDMAHKDDVADAAGSVAGFAAGPNGKPTRRNGQASGG